MDNDYKMSKAVSELVEERQLRAAGERYTKFLKMYLPGEQNFYRVEEDQNQNFEKIDGALETAQRMATDLFSKKYDKTGGKITGGVTIDAGEHATINFERKGKLTGYIGRAYTTSNIGMYLEGDQRTEFVLTDKGTATLTGNTHLNLSAPNLNTDAKEVVKAINELNMDKSSKADEWTFQQKQIASGGDLNNYKERGLYNSWLAANEIGNNPHFNGQFTLIVTSMNNNTDVEQTLLGGGGGATYRRGYDNYLKKWSNWGKVLTSENCELLAVKNGYQKFGTGLIIQWGKVEDIPYNSGKNVTFPITFPNAALNMQATLDSKNDDRGPEYNVNVRNLRKSGARLTNSSDYAVDFYSPFWIAIGY